MPVEEAENLVLANAGEYVEMRRRGRRDYKKGRTQRLEDIT
jgi:hypothetical protein